MYRLLVLVVAIGGACSAASQSGRRVEVESEYQDYEDNVPYTGRRLADCLVDGDMNCLKNKVLSNLDKILQMRSYRLMDGVVLENDPKAAGKDPELEAVDGRNLRSEDGSLFMTLVSKFYNIISQKSLKLNLFPGLSARLSRSSKSNGLVDISIGRGEGGGGFGGSKKGGQGGGFLVIGMFGYMLLAIGVAGAKLLAMKALLVGKISLVLSIISFLKKIMHHKKKKHIIHHHHDSHDFHDEGGGKKGGGGGILIAGMFGYSVLAMCVFAAKMLGIKGIIVAKVALVLASIGYLKKLFSSEKKKHVIHHHSHSSHEHDADDRIMTPYPQYPYEWQNPVQ